MPQPSNTGRIRRLIGAAVRTLAGPASEIRRCPECGRPFMCPIDWEPAGALHWLIGLRCGECGAWREALLTNEEARAFDRELDRQTAEISRALERLERERMAADIDTLVAALRRDLVDAADFAR